MKTGLKLKSIKKNSGAPLATVAVCIALLCCACGSEQNSRKGDAPEPLKTSVDAGLDHLSCTPAADLTLNSANAEQTLWLGDSLFSGKACTYYKNGNIHTLTQYVNGRRQGAWEVYRPDRTLHKQGNVAHGKDDGVYREYHQNGLLKYEYHYRSGAKTGVWKSWYEDGTPYTERHFENDRLHGKVLVWDVAGDLAKEYEYRRGVLVKSRMHFEER